MRRCSLIAHSPTPTLLFARYCLGREGKREKGEKRDESQMANNEPKSLMGATTFLAKEQAHPLTYHFINQGGTIKIFCKQAKRTQSTMRVIIFSFVYFPLYRF